MATRSKPTTTLQITSTSSCTHLAVVKRYSCMYTTDLQKHRKVWHDGFLRIRHFNSKLYLVSEEGHPLAESFLKSSLLNRLAGSTTTPAKKNSEELSSYMKVPPEFELDEDQEIEFDPVEDSESRPSSYLARIVTLIKIETENVPLMTPLTSKARQQAHKRKMEILDQTILQLSKRPKANLQILSSPFSGPDSPSTSIPSSSRRKLAAGFETRPFNSPLINRSKSSKTMIKHPILDPFPTPVNLNQDVEEPHAEASEKRPDGHHPRSKNSAKAKSSKTIVELKPLDPLFLKLDPAKSSHRAERQAPTPIDLNVKSSNNDIQQDHDHQNLDQLNAHSPHPLVHPSNPSDSHPNSPSSSSSNCFDMISKKKTLKINWDSYFQPAKPNIK